VSSGSSGEPAPPTVEVAPITAEPHEPAPATGEGTPAAVDTATSATTATPPSSTVATASSPAADPSPPAVAEQPLLPATYHENDLRSAVGASPLSEPEASALRKRRTPAIGPRDDGDDDDDDRPPRKRKTIVVSALSITAGLAIAALVFVGHANSERYLLACEPERAVPEQGRGFPPWGTRALGGAPWKPLKIAPETRCQPRETDDPRDLERAYLAMILDQATALLTAREVTKLDDAEALLQQALLLTRPPAHEPEKLASERNEHHKDIERLLGDVTYWQASARLHDAAAALADAAKQFDSAAAQHPRHVSDAAAWASYARRLAQELRAGPSGATPATQSTPSPSPAAPAAASPAVSPASATTEHPNVPVGVALPVEAGKGSMDEPPPAAPPPDAGVPTGGVLL
jgi:hypothetical protein